MPRTGSPCGNVGSQLRASDLPAFRHRVYSWSRAVSFKLSRSRMKEQEETAERDDSEML